MFDPEGTAREGIARMEAFFQSLGLATTLHGLGVTDDRFAEMADKGTDGDTRKLGNFVRLDRKAVEQVYRLAA
jgi:hypothetical protein